MPQDPQLISLQKPEKLSKVLEADRQDDCLSCRLTGRPLFPDTVLGPRWFCWWLWKYTGSAALIGLGGYSYFSGRQQLKLQEAKIIQSGSRFGMQSRRAGLVGIAGSLIAMGFWRLVNWEDLGGSSMKDEEGRSYRRWQILVARSCLEVWGTLRALSNTKEWFSLQCGILTTLDGENSWILGCLEPLGLVGVVDPNNWNSKTIDRHYYWQSQGSLCMDSITHETSCPCYAALYANLECSLDRSYVTKANFNVQRTKFIQIVLVYHLYQMDPFRPQDCQCQNNPQIGFSSLFQLPHLMTSSYWCSCYHAYPGDYRSDVASELLLVLLPLEQSVSTCCLKLKDYFQVVKYCCS